MRLSEAIKLGAMLRPQAFGTSFDGIGTCAWGAADEARGKRVHVDMAHDSDAGSWHKAWSWTRHVMMNCPNCDCRTPCYIGIAHLNDAHRWTREAIANEVEKLENQLVEVKEQVEETIGSGVS